MDSVLLSTYRLRISVVSPVDTSEQGSAVPDDSQRSKKWALRSALAAANHSMAVTIAGSVLRGAVLTPLGTYYSLALYAPAPPERRPEIFALLRTSQAVGVVFASALLALFVINGVGLGDRAYDCCDCHGSSHVSWMSVRCIG
jgi:hypothetical protein